MSFITQKMLICGLCRKKASVDEENFPQDLHAVLSKYCIPQIYWICKTCEKSSGLECSVGKILNLEDDVQSLKANVRRLETEMITVKKLIGMRSDDRPGESEFLFDRSLPTYGSHGDSQVPVVNEEVVFTMPRCSQRSRSISPDSSSSSVILHSDVSSPKRNKEALAIIHNILNTKIKIDSEEWYNSNCVVTNFMTCITQSLKEKDPVFNCLYSRDYKTGSSYNDLRISAASEYDIDIVFKMPSQIVLEVNEEVVFTMPRCSQRSRSISPDSSSSSVILHSDVSSPKRNKEALAIIHNILNTKIKIDSEEWYNSNCVVTNFMTCITQSLKEKDPVFNCLYSRDYKTGSSYNDLRISAASEYDIDIVFKMPSQIVLEVEFFKKTMAFAKIKWREESKLPESKAFLLKFLNNNSANGYLQPLKITSWFQGLIDQFLSSQHNISGVRKVRSTQSGPARTIKIETNENYVLDIDLVPVFVFSYNKLAGTQLDEMLMKYPVDEVKKFWFLVPKQCRGEEELLASECALSWRLDFPEVEKKVLHNKQCAKSIIKLLKLLRDINGWKSMASYYLKTLVLWEVDRNPQGEYWKGGVLFNTFLETMKQLQQYLKDQHLPFFFYPSYNLIHGMNKDHCENMRSRLQKLISQIEADPTNIRKIFLDS